MKNKNVLMVAFHFPPCKGSSGIQRTLSFCKNLATQTAWDTHVLTANPSAYVATSNEQMGDIPAKCSVIRSPCLDASRHLAVSGRYLQRTALPDNWSSWPLLGFFHGRRFIRKNGIDLLWSTYPIASAHKLASKLHKSTGIPWIADFRDPMVEWDDVSGQWYPDNEHLRIARLRVESIVARYAERTVFCTKSAREIFLDRYKNFCPEKAHVISNGFDESIFSRVEAGGEATHANRTRANTIRILHSGTLYPGSDRGPEGFLTAVKKYLDTKDESLPTLKVVLRATGFDLETEEIVNRLGLSDIVSIEQPIAYEAAIREMFEADILLVIQGQTSNPAIPAKMYEYIRVGKPILAAVDEYGETLKLAKELGVTTWANPTDVVALTKVIFEMAEHPRKPEYHWDRHRYSREFQAIQLAELMNLTARA